jgi:hypothetical protein
MELVGVDKYGNSYGNLNAAITIDYTGITDYDGYATVDALDSWWRGLVLAVIVLTTIGAMIAVSPNRRA